MGSIIIGGKPPSRVTLATTERGEREQVARPLDQHQRLDVLLRNVADDDDPAIGELDDERRGVPALRFCADEQRDLVGALGEQPGAGVDLDLDLGVLGQLRQPFRAKRVLEGEILDVLRADRERRPGFRGGAVLPLLRIRGFVSHLPLPVPRWPGALRDLPRGV